MVEGLIFDVKKSPKDLSLQQRPLSRLIATGTLGILSFYHMFNALCNSVLLINADTVNTASVIVNGDRANPFILAASGSLVIDSQWIEQLDIQAGAAGPVRVLAQLVPEETVL